MKQTEKWRNVRRLNSYSSTSFEVLEKNSQKACSACKPPALYIFYIFKSHCNFTRYVWNNHLFHKYFCLNIKNREIKCIFLLISLTHISSKAATWGVLYEKMFFKKFRKFRKFRKIHRKHLCQSLDFNNVTGLRPATLLKKRPVHWCFPVNSAKFLRTLFLQNTSGRLLLFLLIWYSLCCG